MSVIFCTARRKIIYGGLQTLKPQRYRYYSRIYSKAEKTFLFNES